LVLKSFHSCKKVGSGAVVIGCGWQSSLLTGRLTIASVERCEEVLVGPSHRKFDVSELVLWLHQTLDFGAVNTSLVEGGLERFVACVGCRGVYGWLSKLSWSS